MNAWPALETFVSDGWVLRFSEGYTRRANSVQPLEPGVRGLADKIDEAQRLYDERGLPPMFKMTSGSEPSGLDLALAERGYEWAAGTSVRVASLAHMTSAPLRVDLSWDGAREWREAFHRMSDVGLERRAIHDRMLSRIVPPAGYASLDLDGRMVACALGVVQQGWLGVFHVVVDGDERRKGYGEQLMRGLMDWGCALGAERAYLQVMLENAPALALYDRLGFREAYQYWYRVRRSDKATPEPTHADSAGGYGFSYCATQGGDVLIRRDGHIVTHLRHGAARDFLAEADGAGAEDAQKTMARYTGNYKRGNERTAKEHPRRRE